MQETWVQSLGREDPLEEGMATHSSTLAWRSHGQRSPVGYSPFGREETDTAKQLNTTRHKGSQSRHWGFRWFLEDSWASKSGFRWLSGKRITCQCRRLRRCRFDPWVWNSPWRRRKSQSRPVSLPGKFHEQRSLEGYSPGGCKESDLTEPALTAPKTPVGMGEEVKRKAEKVRRNVSNWAGHCWLISPHLGSEGRRGNLALCASFSDPDALIPDNMGVLMASHHPGRVTLSGSALPIHTDVPFLLKMWSTFISARRKKAPICNLSRCLPEAWGGIKVSRLLQEDIQVSWLWGFFKDHTS